MFSALLLLAVSSIFSSTEAQNATETYVESAVPTGTPIPGDYTGALRPQIHFSPPKYFMVSQSNICYFIWYELLNVKNEQALQEEQ